MQEFVILETESPTFGGRVFGAAGPYERLTGYAIGAVDPAEALNAGIVNLDKAPRDAAGKIAYRCDICILRPVDPAKGNGWLFHEVLNRGAKRAICRLNTAPATNGSRQPDDAGNGFLMEQGFTLLWSGWQDDVDSGDGRMRAEYPIATDGGAPITGVTLEEIIEPTNAPQFTHALPYPAASLDPAGASLTIREKERDPRQRPDGLDWRYLDDRRIEITRPADDAFDAGAIFEFIYTATDPTVTGLAFASVRDIVCFLRQSGPDAAGNANPLAAKGAEPPQRSLLFGISQSGRFLRDSLYLGFNQALSGGPVFDAVVPVVAGSRKTFINYAFAQPGRYQRQHEDHNYPGDQFPFAYPMLSDPISGLTDGILARCDATGTAPKIMHFDSETEMWSARASLVVTDCDGNDIAQPDNVRVYLAAGIPHGWAMTPDAAALRLPDNDMRFGALLRPLIAAMVRWVEDDTAPPPSCFPSVAAGTLATLDKTGFPDIPGSTYPQALNGLRLADHAQVPPLEGAAYPVLVSTVDVCGNGNDGIRHPALRVPVATLTGWNLRAPGHGEGEIYGTIGACLPLAATKAERLANGDPRPSIEELYADNADFVAKLRAAVEDMIADGTLLRDDAERIVAAAQAGETILTAA